MSTEPTLQGFTLDQVKEKITALGDVDEDVKKSLVCSLVGHSNILDGCFGYMHCGRCDAQIGDTLGGSYTNEKAVIIGHDCDDCQANAWKLTWRDTFMAKDPEVTMEPALASRIKRELERDNG